MTSDDGLRFRVEVACMGYQALTDDDVPQEYIGTELDAYKAGAAAAAEAILSEVNLSSRADVGHARLNVLLREGVVVKHELSKDCVCDPKVEQVGGRSLNDMLAQRFHDAYERLAPSVGYETRPESAKPWSEVPEQNKRLMRLVMAKLRFDGYIVVPYPGAPKVKGGDGPVRNEDPHASECVPPDTYARAANEGFDTAIKQIIAELEEYAEEPYEDERNDDRAAYLRDAVMYLRGTFGAGVEPDGLGDGRGRDA